MLVNAVPVERRDVQAAAAGQSSQAWYPWSYSDDDDDNDYDYSEEDVSPEAWNEDEHRQDPYTPSTTWNVKKGVNSVNADAHRFQGYDGPWNPLSGLLGVLGGLFGDREEPTYIIIPQAALPQSYTGGFAVPPGYAPSYPAGVAGPGGIGAPLVAYPGGYGAPGVRGPLPYPKGIPINPASGGARPKGWPPVVPAQGIVGALPGGGYQGINIGSAGFSLDGTSGATPAPVVPRPTPVAPPAAGITGALQSGVGQQGLGIASAGFSLDGTSGAAATPVAPGAVNPIAVTPAPVAPVATPPAAAGIVGTLQSGAGLQGLNIGSAGFSLDSNAAPTPAGGASPIAVTPAPVAAPPAAAGLVGTLQSGAGLQGLNIGSAGFSLDSNSPATPAAAPAAAVTPAPALAPAAPVAAGIAGTVQSGAGLQGLNIGSAGFSLDGNSAAATPVAAPAMATPMAAAPSAVGAQGLNIGSASFSQGS